MNYRCAHRWAFPKWGAALEEMTDELAAPVGQEVTVRVTHCGMCHSDLHVQAGGFDMGGGKMSSLERAGTKLPVTMGHEIGGEVVEIGPEVQGVKLGDKVIVYPWLGCGSCPVCERGDDHLCPRASRNMGIQLPGGYADLVRVPHARYLVPIGTLEPARAATFACAGITAYGAIRKLDPLDADDHVAIIGCGGVGMTAVALYVGHHARRKVVAIDPDPAKREAALRHGATMAFDPGAADALKAIGKACNMNIAGAVDFVGCRVQLVAGGEPGAPHRAGGHRRPVRRRVPHAAADVRAEVAAASAAPTWPACNELRELVALAQRVTLPQIPLDLRPLAGVNQALDDLAHGRVVGRVVLQP